MARNLTLENINKYIYICIYHFKSTGRLVSWVEVGELERPLAVGNAGGCNDAVNSNANDNRKNIGCKNSEEKN